MVRPQRPQPRELVDTGSWPNAVMVNHAGETAAQIARHLAAVIEQRQLPVRHAAQASGLDHNKLRRILSGESWADITDLAGLETGLGIELVVRHEQ